MKAIEYYLKSHTSEVIFSYRYTTQQLHNAGNLSVVPIMHTNGIDLTLIDSADLFIVFGPYDRKTSSEIGYALGKGIKILYVPSRDNADLFSFPVGLFPEWVTTINDRIEDQIGWIIRDLDTLVACIEELKGYVQETNHGDSD